MCADECEARNTVIERRRVPPPRGMAGCAVAHRERRTSRRVRRVSGLLPLRKVAPGIPAIRRGNLQIVIVVDVTGGAGNVGVTVREQKTSEGVIEVCAVPAFRGMAARAVGYRKYGAGAGVDRILRLLPGGEVASGISAIRQRDLQIVVIVDVARGARHSSVTVRQREARGAVIKLRTRPGIERMAGLAGRRKISRGVIGVRGFLIVRQMTRRTRR